ncbi:fluoride efflux transporter CrcB [Salinicoccus sp. Marseille-QA3877]
MKYLFVMVGGFFGTISRFAVSEWFHTAGGFPFPTLFVNLAGCFALGWLLTYISRKTNIRPEYALIIGTGFIGSFTTFSTFTVETLTLFSQGFLLQAMIYVAVSIIIGLLMTYIGYKLASPMKRRGDSI